jgi:LAO/AO transport system kinase
LRPVVLGASALHREGIAQLWTAVVHCRDAQARDGGLARKRAQQALAWTWHLIDAGLRQRFRDDGDVKAALPGLLRDVESGALTPTAAAAQLLSRGT